MLKLTKKQATQEEEYIFPYHYLDLILNENREIKEIERMSLISKIKGLVKKFNPKKILDAGCGDGRLCYELKKYFDITGMDYSERAIRFAKAFNPEVDFFVRDLDSVNSELENKIDFILLIETLEHIKPEKIRDVLKNMSRYLKEGGKILITVPSTNIKLGDKHYQHFTPELLKEVLNDFFIVNETRGHLKKSPFFKPYKKLCEILYPLQSRIKLVKWINYKFVNYFKKNIENADLDNCKRLICIATKRN